MQYNQKVCLVTASSTGIGYAISHKFAQQGATVIINSRNKQNVDQAVKNLAKQGFKAQGYVCHAAKSQDIQNMIKHVQERYGRLDVLVCNAAVSTHFGASIDMNETQFDKMMEVNLKGTFMLIKYAHPLLQKTKDANIIIMASYAGYELDMGIGIYAVTKTALIGMAKLFSKEFKEENIRVNCIAPGLIKTKFSSGLWESDEKQAIDTMKVNRLGVPEDIANVASFLASEQASYINGETIVVAGRPGARL